MEKIDFKKQNIPFTQVANGVLNDPKISFMAKGLYAYLYSKPEGWNFSSSRIAKDSNNGRDSVRKCLSELEKSGYLKRYKLPNGRLVYKVIFPPLEPETEKPSLGQEPETEKATDGNSHSGETSRISNKEIKVIKSISNKDSVEASSTGLEINQLIELFKELNPTYTYLFKRKDNRSSAERLLKLRPIEDWKRVISFIGNHKFDKFCPRITTPSQLEQKYAELETYGATLKVKPQSKYKVAF